MSGIYTIALSDGRIYVGSAVCIRTRWNRHKHDLRRGKHHSSYLQRAWDKYGESAFTFSVVEVCQPHDLIAREQFWMGKLKPVFNTQPIAGSSLGTKHTEATRRKLAIIAAIVQKGRKHSEESKLKRSLALRGRKPSQQCIAATIRACAGKRLSPEHREKIRLANLRMTDATKRKISLAGIGRKQSPETIAKRAAHRIGTHLPEATRRKIREANLRRFRRGQLDLPL